MIELPLNKTEAKKLHAYLLRTDSCVYLANILYRLEALLKASRGKPVKKP